MKRIIIAILLTMLVGNMMLANDWAQVKKWDNDSVQLIETADSTYYLVQNGETFDMGNYTQMIMLCTDIVKVWDYLKTGDTFSIDEYMLTKKEKSLEIKCSDNGILKINLFIITDILKSRLALF